MSTPGAAGPGAPFPQWVVTSQPGHKVSKITSAAAKAVYEATNFPWTSYWFTGQKAAENFAVSKWGNATETPILNNAANAATDTTVSTASAVVSDAAAVTDFLGKLSSPNTWIRVAKILVGGALLIIGLAHATGADNTVASVARKVPLPV